MQNQINLKTLLKTSIREEQLRKEKYFTVSFTNIEKNKRNKSFKITKKEFNQTKFSTIINTKKSKFPLEVTLFKSEKTLRNEKIQINNIHKIKEYIYIKKNDIKFFTINTNEIYSNILNRISQQHLFSLIESKSVVK